MSFPYPSFETQRLLLRPVTEADIPNWHRHFNCFEIIGDMSASVPWPFPADGTEKFVRNEVLPNLGRDKWTWAITLKEAPHELVGIVDLWREGCPENRGFWLAPHLWGQGLMSEATAPITDYAFDVLGFDTLVFNNALGNTRSRRIKEKAGARLVRVIDKKFNNPAYTQAEIWELSKDAWQLKRNSKEK